MSYKILKVGGTGKGENEFGSHAFGADHVDILAVGLDDLFYNGKPQSGSFFILASGQIRLVKTLPYFFLTVLWNTDSRIFYRDKYLLIPPRRLDVDGGVLVAEFDCVVNKIVQHLLYFPKVSVYHLDTVGKGKIKA